MARRGWLLSSLACRRSSSKDLTSSACVNPYRWCRAVFNGRFLVPVRWSVRSPGHSPSDCPLQSAPISPPQSPHRRALPAASPHPYHERVENLHHFPTSQPALGGVSLLGEDLNDLVSAVHVVVISLKCYRVSRSGEEAVETQTRLGGRLALLARRDREVSVEH